MDHINTYRSHIDHITHIGLTLTYRLPEDPLSMPLPETNI